MSIMIDAPSDEDIRWAILCEEERQKREAAQWDAESEEFADEFLTPGEIAEDAQAMPPYRPDRTPWMGE